MKDEYAFDFNRFTTDYFEYEQGQKHIIARSGIKENLSSWKSTGASNFVLHLIENGYKLQLYSNSPKSLNKNNKSALLESEFVAEAIQDLLDRN